MEGFIPVHQIGQDGKRVGRELVEAGSKLVGNLAFIHEQRELRVAHGKLAAVLDLAVLHGIAVGENSIRRLHPVNDVNELLAEKRF